MNKPQQVKYTFILTAYRPRFLAEAIRSILAQDFMDFRLVIVNDASPDDLDEIVEAFDDDRISYFRHSENTGGKSLARHWNNCLGYADSEYVILASDDDTYDSDFLSVVDSMANRYPQADVIAARIRYIDSSGNVVYTSPQHSEYMSCAQYAMMYCDEKVLSAMQNHVFRLSALSAAGGFVEFPLAWHTDDATVLALSFGGVAYTQQPLFSFRISGESISSARPEKSAYLKKFEARGQLWTWFNDTFMSALADKSPETDCVWLTNRLKSKLRHLSMLMLFEADLSTAWAVRRGFLRQPFVSSSDYYRFMAKKIWNDYKYMFNASRWPQIIKNATHGILRQSS